MPIREILQNGTTANDGSGDTLRNAADKINQNFQSLFNIFGDSVNASDNFALDSDGKVIFSDPTSVYVTKLDAAPATGGNKYVVLPNGSGTVVLTDNTAVLTNKSLVSPRMSEILDSAAKTVLTFNGQSDATHNLELRNGDSSMGVNLCVKGTDSVDVDLCLTPRNNGVIKTFGHVVPEWEQLTTSGSCSVHTPVTFCNSGVAITVSLADGTAVGQEKKFVSLNSGTATISPSSFVHHSGNSEIEIETYSALTLFWTGTNWHIMSVSDSGINVVN